MATTKAYAPTFQHYLDSEFNPAQLWASSEEGAKWISEHIPTLDLVMQKFYDKPLFAVYCIRVNEVPLYVGQSIRTVRRLCVHAWNMCYKPELFGLTTEDLPTNSISVEFLETAIYNESLRKESEVYYIGKLKPLIQRCDGTDVCLPKDKRAENVRPYLKKEV